MKGLLSEENIGFKETSSLLALTFSLYSLLAGLDLSSGVIGKDNDKKYTFP
jgi:hypothetical protein